MDKITKSFMSRLNWSERIAEHSFIQEALDDLLQGSTVDSYRSRTYFNSPIPEMVDEAMITGVDTPSHKSKKTFFWLDEVITGTRHALKSHPKQKTRLKKLINLKKHGYQYAVFVFNRKTHQCSDIHPVRIADFKALIKQIKVIAVEPHHWREWHSYLRHKLMQKQVE